MNRTSNTYQNETGMSRILFMSSRDCRNVSGNPNLTTHFQLNLEEPITIPPHHAVKMYIHRVTIPHTFFNFVREKNTELEIDLRQIAYGGDPDDAVTLSSFATSIPEGNWNAISLSNLIMNNVNKWLNGATKLTPSRGKTTITDPITDATIKGIALWMSYDEDELRYKWILHQGTNAGPTANDLYLVFKFATGTYGGQDPATRTNFQEEIGFNQNTWVDDYNQDFWCRFRTSGGVDLYAWGTKNNIVGQDTTVLHTIDSSDYPTCGYNYRDFAWTGKVESGITLPTSGIALTKAQVVFSVVDTSYHIRSLYIRTNLSSHSVMDSKVQGRFTTLLARLPNDVNSGANLEIAPSDGATHQLMVKTREIDKVEISLTDLNSQLIDLNGVEWNISLQFDFIDRPRMIQVDELPRTPKTPKEDDKLKKENTKYKRFLKNKGKTKELEAFAKYEKDIMFPMNQGGS